jgi:hypothetical protein
MLVSSKEDVFELMADEVFGEIPLPRRLSGGWRQNLRTIARNTRGTFHREVARAELVRRLRIDEASWRARFDAHVEDAGRHDEILAEQMRIRAHLLNDRNFEIGLGCILRGIEAHISSGESDES